MAVRKSWRSRIGLRGATVLAGGLAICIGLAIVLLGRGQVDLVRRLAAEGSVVQGRYLNTTYADGDGFSHRVVVGYTVGGRDYRLESLSRGGREPLIGPEVIDNPRFGPPAPFQVIYLPGDPGTARLRGDLDVETLPYYAGGGFFALIGAIFVAVGWFLLRPSKP